MRVLWGMVGQGYAPLWQNPFSPYTALLYKQQTFGDAHASRPTLREVKELMGVVSERDFKEAKLQVPWNLL